MKSYLTKILMGFSFLIIGGLTVANAQINSDAILKIKVPFAFKVREKMMPAGEYIIKTADDTGDANTLLQIYDVDKRGKAAIFDSVPLSVSNSPTKSNIIFGKVRGNYYLSEIWEEDNANGNQVEEPVNMKKIEKNGMKMEKEVIAAKMAKKP